MHYFIILWSCSEFHYKSFFIYTVYIFMHIKDLMTGGYTQRSLNLDPCVGVLKHLINNHKNQNPVMFTIWDNHWPGGTYNVVCEQHQKWQNSSSSMVIAIRFCQQTSQPEKSLEKWLTRSVRKRKLHLSLPWALELWMSEAISKQLKAHFSPNERQNMVQSDSEPTASVRPRHAGNMLLFSQFPRSPKETVRAREACCVDSAQALRGSSDRLADAERLSERGPEKAELRWSLWNTINHGELSKAADSPAKQNCSGHSKFAYLKPSSYFGEYSQE